MKKDKKYAISVGTFDGLHLGHMIIIEKLLELSKSHNLKPKIFVMKYPSVKYFNDNFPGIIMNSNRRKKILEKMGIEAEIFELPEVMNKSKEEYLNELLNIGMKAFVCGKDFTFGKNKEGNVDYLYEVLNKKGVILEVFEDIEIDGKRISSSIIRELIKNGEIEKANKYLGRNWIVEGHVYKNKQLGRKLGFPTANIDFRESEEIIIPRFGVYLVRGKIQGYYKKYWGLMNVGVRPTLYKTNSPKLEVYFLDFKNDIYDRYVEIEVLKFIRPEKKFENLEKLKKAMKNDEKKAREIIKEMKVYE